MRRATYALVGVLTITLVIFAVVADRALVDQTRSAEAAARAEDARAAQLTAQAVGAALDQTERAIAGGSPGPGTVVALAVDADYHSAARRSAIPYGRRPERELRELLSSTGLSGSGLPEAAVAAAALDRPEGRRAVAERLLSGTLPVGPGDLSYLADVLGVGSDPRVASLASSLQRAQAVADPPALPKFQRALIGHGSIEGWSRDGRIVQHYEIAVDELLNAAGVRGRASAVASSTQPGPDAPTTVVPVPEVGGLALAVARSSYGQVRLRSLRIVLWVAMVTSVLGLAGVLRGLRGEARAIARERAFIGSVTHELRTPLAAIRLLGERLAADRGESKEYGAMVAAECERLETLVEHVLTATRADEKLVLAPLDPVELVRSAVRLIAPSAEKREVTVSIHDSLRAAPLPEVLWDRDAVRRALLNLLDNAIKHGHRGGLVTLSGGISDGAVRLSVADDGPGIGRRDRKRVFGRFERGAAAGPGTGLGLHVSERIARAHGGRIELVTEETRGSTFTLVLPIVPPGAAMSEAKGATA